MDSSKSSLVVIHHVHCNSWSAPLWQRSHRGGTREASVSTSNSEMMMEWSPFEHRDFLMKGVRFNFSAQRETDDVGLRTVFCSGASVD